MLSGCLDRPDKDIRGSQRAALWRGQGIGHTCSVCSVCQVDRAWEGGEVVGEVGGKVTNIFIMERWGWLKTKVVAW